MNTNKSQKRGLIRNWHCLPYNPRLTDRAKEMRNHMTLAEEKLWTGFLKNHEFRFRPQKQIDNYIVDFYCAKLKLVIEIDGEAHAEQEQVSYDKERTNVLKSYGLEVLRFKNEEIINNFDEVCSSIDEFKKKYCEDFLVAPY